MAPVLIDFEKVCRLCFREDDGHGEMTSLYERQDLEETIRRCVQIEVIVCSNEPTNICASCLLCLDSWNKFKMLCDNTNAFIQQYLQNNESDSVFNSELNLGTLGFTPSQMSPMSNLSFGVFESDSVWNNMFQQWDDVDPTCTDLPGPRCIKKVQPSEDVLIESVSGEECMDIALSVLDKKDDNFTFKKAHWWNPKAISMKSIKNQNRKPTSTTETSKPMSKYNRYERKTYNCEICSEMFTKFNDLIVHDSKVHIEMPKNYRCDECGKLFLSNGRLEIHKKVHREKLFGCNLCQKKFTLQKTLDKHLNVHMALYTCQECGYNAASSYTLKIHEDTHSLVKKHLCEECQKCFATLSSLRRHNRLVHQKEALYQCDQCDYVTAITTNLKLHKSIHTPYTFICHHCGRNFKNHDLLRLHLKKYTKSEYKCLHCTKIFRRKANLKIHLSKNHELGPVIKRVSKCDICEKCFSRNKFLLKHKKEFHPTIVDI